MPLHTLQAITSLDGRYRMLVEDLATHLSEFALHKNRLRVECEYLIALSEEKKVGVRKLTEEEKKTLRSMAENFSLEDAAIVQKIEKEGRNGIPATNHDVKAVEYFLKLKLDETSLKDGR